MRFLEARIQAMPEPMDGNEGIDFLMLRPGESAPTRKGPMRLIEWVMGPQNIC